MSAGRLHLALFYCYGIFYHLSHRLAGVRFISITRPLQRYIWGSTRLGWAILGLKAGGGWKVEGALAAALVAATYVGLHGCVTGCDCIRHGS